MISLRQKLEVRLTDAVQRLREEFKEKGRSLRRQDDGYLSSCRHVQNATRSWLSRWLNGGRSCGGWSESTVYVDNRLRLLKNGVSILTHD